MDPTADKDVNAALSIVNERLLDLQGAPHVSEIQAELAVDSNGEAAAFITVVLDDESGAVGEPYAWPRLKPIHDLIWTAFTEGSVSRWPHIEFRLKSELGDAADDGAQS